MNDIISKFEILNKKNNKNVKLIKKIRRLLYLKDNNIPIYVGKNDGLYYLTDKSKIYI